MTVTRLQPQSDPTLEDVWKIWNRKRRGDKGIAEAKWNDIISPAGLHTLNKDHETGAMIPRHWQASPLVIFRGAKAYIYDTWDLEEIKYIKHVSTFLNRGGWTNYTEDEIDEMVMQYDRTMARIAERRG